MDPEYYLHKRYEVLCLVEEINVAFNRLAQTIYSCQFIDPEFDEFYDVVEMTQVFINANQILIQYAKEIAKELEKYYLTRIGHF